MTQLPNPESVWRHYKGNMYEVIGIANGNCDRSNPTQSAEHPLLIIYRGTDGSIWTRPPERWFDKMSLISDPRAVKKRKAEEAERQAKEQATHNED